MESLKDFPHLYSQDFKLLNPLKDEELQDVCSKIKKRMERLTSKDAPRVSVIFPAYNEAMYLPLMLWTLSKLATNIPLEIIWVNNASTDNTGEIIEQSWIKRVDESRKWVSYARQAWLEMACGEIVATTDADTQVPETWIDANIRYFENNSELVWISWGSRVKNHHRLWEPSLNILRLYLMLERIILLKLGFLDLDDIPQTEHIDSFSWANMFFRKDIVSWFGGYSLGYNFGEDALLGSKLKNSGLAYSVIGNPEISVQTSSRRVQKIWWVISMLRHTLEHNLWRKPRQFIPDRPLDFSDIR